MVQDGFSPEKAKIETSIAGMNHYVWGVVVGDSPREIGLLQFSNVGGGNNPQ